MNNEYTCGDSIEKIRICLKCSEPTCHGNPCPLLGERPKEAYSDHHYQMDGESRTVKEWAALYDLNSRTLYHYLAKCNYDMKRAIDEASKRNRKMPKKYAAYGFSFTLRQWAALCELHPIQLYQRLKRMCPEEAFIEAKGKIL